ncbi:MAG: ATP phosphoribosyltransferase regulatory subunit [Clostridia bacterium]|nr:ATP phosphoribosyltransferase regulatory subunit [Clostridia bacterium]
MYKLNKNIPEGTRDLLYAEADLYEKITDGFTKIYVDAGFRPISTPVVENYDMVAAVNQSIKQENVYKLTDNTGHLLAMRPDNTTPIARVVATKLKNAAMPQKLYYNQHIYRINSDYSGKRNEILQSGIELVGASGLKSDLLCIMTALETLKSLNLKCKLEIGHVGYFNALINEMNLSEDEVQTVRSFVDAKNYVSLNMFDKNLQNEKIRKLPLLYGNDEVFAEAFELAGENQDAVDALNYVKKLYELLKNAGYEEYIMVDMGMVHKFDYYTGLVFRGYIDNAGEPVLKGGRYDRLLASFDYDQPAIGFAVNVCAVADALIKSGKLCEMPSADAIVHYNEETYADAIKVKNSYVERGLTCELSVFDTLEETNNYAKNMNVETVIDTTKESEAAEK